MRKKEERFVSERVSLKASAWGKMVLAARLSQNLTQSAAAERARMSQFTWLKIEKGDVSVSMGAWLSALDIIGLLDETSLPAVPTLPQKKRLRARQSSSIDNHYDF